MPLIPEQDFGAAFLAGRRVAMLADRVGFGKTAQIVRACDFVQAQRITILCPPVLCANERAQFEQWALFGWPIAVLKSGADPIPADGIVVCSYNLAGTDRVREALMKRGCDALILDESHALKTPGGVRTKAVFGKRGIASTAARAWFVTGTPTPNHAGEYYVFAKACGAWTGTYWQFVDRYCVTIAGHFGKKIVGSRDDTRAELLASLAPYLLGRDAVEDGRPPLEIDTLAIDGAKPDFTGVAPETLQAIETAIAAEDWTLLDGPSVSTVRRLVGVAKARAAADVIAYEMESPDVRPLVFCEHRAVIDAINEKLTAAGHVVGVIDGRTTNRDRENTIASFEPGGSGPHRAAIIQRQSLKEGRTMTQSNRVFLVEPPWTPDDAKQMIARAWRRGQTRPVRASLLHLPGSLDEAVSRTVARKARDIELITVRAA